MTDLDLDALIAEARDWAATVPLGKPAAREVDRGILFARRLASALEASVARIREAEEDVDGEAAAHNDTISAWREAEDKLREAEATIDEVEDFVTRHYLDTTMGERVLGILTRHQDKREGE